MADRSIKVTLRADATDFTRNMQAAGKAVEDVAKKGADVGKDGASVMQRMAASARDQRAQWSQVGGALAGVGAAWTAVNVAVAKTGIEYNTLQQTSRAALRTMLGDSEAVNAQMTKLDAFAKTSPFSKSTFITAQQQMLAFGIEAEKVIPYLSAINDATAAAGGNNQTLSELAFIMAQIGAAGKITAQDLMQFGQRGINAAELIGSQMGKTGAQIRDDITKGALDANDALDALAAGMSERFEGASANVKDTMGGALDRVSAAWRDLSASIMSSAVSPDGGGWLVDLTNQVADFIRAIDAMPDGVKQVTGVVSGIGGVAATAAGGFMLLAPRIVETRDALLQLGKPGAAALGTMKGLGRAVPVVAAAALGIAAVGQGVSMLVNETRGIEGVAGAVERLADASQNVKSLESMLPQRELFGVEVNARSMVELFEQLEYWDRDTFLNRANNQFISLVEILSDFESQGTVARNTLREIDTALANMPIEEAGVAFAKLTEGLDLSDAELVEAFPQHVDRVNEALKGVENASIPLMGILRGEIPEGLAVTADGMIVVAGTADTLTVAEKDAAEAAKAHEEALSAVEKVMAQVVDTAQAYGNALLALTGSEMAVESAIANLNETIAKNTEEYGKNAGGLDLTTEAGRSNQRALDDLARASMAYVQTLHDQNASNEEIADATARAKEQWIAGAVAMGKSAEEAAVLAEAYFAIPTEVATWIEAAGLDVASANLADWERALDELSEEEKTEFFAQLDGASADEVRQRLNELARDRTMTVHVAQTGGVTITPTIRGGGRGIDIPGNAEGGKITGPGTSTSDSILRRLSDGEFVIKTASAKSIGYDALEAMNRFGRIPGHASGGRVSATYAPSRQYAMAGSTSTTYGDTHVTQHLHFPGVDDIITIRDTIRDAQRQARLQGGRR